MAPPFKKKKVSSCNYIPDDIAFSILSKLPIKSLNRFLCVKKSWSLVLENPNFMKMFRNNLLSKSHSLNDDNDACMALLQLVFVNPFHDWKLSLLPNDNLLDGNVRFDLPHHFDGDAGFDIHILGSAIDGIVCIYDFNNHDDVIFWNPATQEVKEIPPSLAEFSPEFRTKFTLNGFGYDNIRDDFKLIQHVNYIPRDECACDDVTPNPFWEIYSLESNSWRKLDFDMPNRNLTTDTEAYFNGVCHWYTKTDNKNLVSFNLSNEAYCITPLPLELHDGFSIDITMLNGFVTVISNYQFTMSFQISILAEIGVKESWFRLLNVGPLASIEHPMGAGKKNNIFFRLEDGNLACLDLTTGMIEEIADIEDYWCQVIVYKENLHPIEGINN